MFRIIFACVVWMIFSIISYSAGLGLVQMSSDRALYGVFGGSWLIAGYICSSRWHYTRELPSGSIIAWLALGFFSLPFFMHVSGVGPWFAMVLFIAAASAFSLYVQMTSTKDSSPLSLLQGLAIAFAIVMATTPLRLIVQPSSTATSGSIAWMTGVWAAATATVAVFGALMRPAATIYDLSVPMPKASEKPRSGVVQH